jgi:glucose-1-phosphate cytidylyltransferase
MIKEYFANYHLHSGDVTFDIAARSRKVHRSGAERWKVTLVDTGQLSGTGGRLRRVREYLGDEDFCFTYGDGVADVDVAASVDFHRSHGAAATVTAVKPGGRFGALAIDGDGVRGFGRSPGDGGWINGGFYVLSPRAVDFIAGDATVWEEEPLTRLADDGELRAYRHDGFYYAMDTVRDRNHLQELWEGGAAPWKTWE